MTVPAPIAASPRVTILMPVYNGCPYLAAAIESMLGQSFTDFELLIVDDASTDDSRKVAAGFADPRIRLLANERNLGLIGTLNVGLRAARGEYVARMDQDDWSLPQRLERQVAYMDGHAEVGALGTGFQLMDAAGAPGVEVLFPASHASIRWSLAFFSPLAHPTVMMRRRLVAAVGGYRDAAVHCEDYDLWWRLSRATRIANLPEILLRLRKHDTSITARYVVAHGEQGRRVCRDMLAGILAVEVPSGVIFHLWGLPAAPAAQLPQAVHVLVRHYRSCRATAGASAEERAALRADFGRRLWRLLAGSRMPVGTRLWTMLRRIAGGALRVLGRRGQSR